MKILGTYSDLDRFAVLSDSFSSKAFSSPDVRRAYYSDFKLLSKHMEDHELTKEFNELNEIVQAFNADATEENQKDPERVARMKDLNSQIKALNEKKEITQVLFDGWSEFSWNEGFKPAYEKEGGDVYRSAKQLSVIDDWIVRIEEYNKGV